MNRARTLNFIALAYSLVATADAQPAGALDPSFGNGGFTTTSLGDAVNAGLGEVAIQTDGNVLVAGRGQINGADGFNFVARYLPNGALDPAFGSAGVVTTYIGSGSPAAYGLAVQPDGRIVVAGRSGNFLATVIRYESDGRPDSAFGGNGIVMVVTPPEFGRFEEAYDVVLLPDGRSSWGARSGTTGSMSSP